TPPDRMPRKENQSVRRLAMSQGNLRCRCGPQSGGDARDNFKLYAGFAQSCDFLAHAPEDQRVSTLEPHHLQSRSRQSDHEKVNLFLADVLFPAALADVTNLGVRRREAKYRFSNQF